MSKRAINGNDLAQWMKRNPDLIKENPEIARILGVGQERPDARGTQQMRAPPARQQTITAYKPQARQSDYIDLLPTSPTGRPNYAGALRNVDRAISVVNVLVRGYNAMQGRSRQRRGKGRQSGGCSSRIVGCGCVMPLFLIGLVFLAGLVAIASSSNIVHTFYVLF